MWPMTEIFLSKSLTFMSPVTPKKRQLRSNAPITPTQQHQHPRQNQAQVPATPKSLQKRRAPIASSVLAQLRAFDLDSRYGPCTGLTRRERYDRAVKLGKRPPECIAELLDGYDVDGYDVEDRFMLRHHLWINEL